MKCAGCEKGATTSFVGVALCPGCLKEAQQWHNGLWLRAKFNVRRRAVQAYIKQTGASLRQAITARRSYEIAFKGFR